MFTSNQYIEEFQLVFVVLIFALFILMQAVDSCALRPVAANQPSGPRFSRLNSMENKKVSTDRAIIVATRDMRQPAADPNETGRL
jgi:hypothetical protein